MDLRYNSRSVKIKDKGKAMNRSRIKRTFFQTACTVALLLGSTQLQAKWGATALDEKFRPARAWMNNFSAVPDVVANGSIASAIASCDSVVGVKKYCVVEIGDNATGLPLEIERSNTKLLGVPGMQPLTSSKNGTFIYIGDGVKRVAIEGLDIEGHSAGNKEIYAIIVDGKSIRNIAILNNKIHGFDSNENAHGIAVYGTGATNAKAISNVIIEGNSVYEMRTGSSESIVVNGNVKKWEIKSNDVYDINNIAIDAIGGEGTSPSRKNSSGRVLPGKVDAARYGFIEDNFVENMHTTDNPAYGRKESWAAAIYIDGGHHIQIKDNVVMNSAWGYEVGAENCLVSRHITMTGNSAEESYYGDLLLGGYAKKGFFKDKSINCNPNNTRDANEGHGYVRYLTIKENLFSSSDTELDPISLQYRTTNAIIVEPGIEAVNETGNGSARNDENAVRITE